MRAFSTVCDYFRKQCLVQVFLMAIMYLEYVQQPAFVDDDLLISSLLRRFERYLSTVD